MQIMWEDEDPNADKGKASWWRNEIAQMKLANEQKTVQEQSQDAKKIQTN